MYGKPSAFLRRAARAARSDDGRPGDAAAQGALAFTIWTGRRAPLAVMRRALR